MLPVTFFCAVTAVILTGFIHGQSIIDGPDDATGLIGGTAQFHCTVEFGVFQELTWEFNDKIIYAFIDDDVEYPMVPSKYNVKKNNNSFTLQVRNLNYTDGGIYSCVAYLPTASAVLVVLGKPIISLHPSHPVKGRSVNLTCAAQFGGPDKDSISPEHYPELLMYLDGKLLDIPISDNQNQLSKSLDVMTETRMNGQELSCQVKTSNPDMSTRSDPLKLKISRSNDGPIDATGQIGGTAQFHCKVEFGESKKMTWEFNDKMIYSFLDDDVEYPMGSSKYNVIKDSNSFTLHVRDLNYTDGGTYSCGAFLPVASAVLVVLGEPRIMINPSHPVGGQFVNLTCAVQFGGPFNNFLSPEHYSELLMYLDEKLLDIPISKNKNQLSKTHSVMAETRMNGQELSCQVRTTNPEMNTLSYHVKSKISLAETEDVTNTTVFVVIGMLVGLCLPGIIIFLYIRRKRKQHNENHVCIEDEHVPLRSEDAENQTEKVQTGDQSSSEKDIILLTEDVSDSKEVPLSEYNQGNDVPPRREDVKNRPKKVQTGYQSNYFKSEVALDSKDKPLSNPFQGNEEVEAVSLINVEAEYKTEKVQTCDQPRQMKDPISPNENMSNSKEKPSSNTQGIEDAEANTLRSEDSKNQPETVEAGDQSIHLEGNAEVEVPSRRLGVENQPIKVEKDQQSKYLKSVSNSKSGDEEVEIPPGSEDVGNQPETVEADDPSKQLKDLILQLEYVSDAKKKLIWSEDLILQVKELLQNGADPNWITLKECWEKNRRENFTATYKFFSAIVHILLLKGELFSQIKSLVPFFMLVKSHNAKFIRGNALHALVEVDWKRLSEQSIPEDLFSHYQEIILTVINEESSLINETDWNGRTPLHLLFQGLQLQEERLESFAQIVQHLRSNTNLDIVDNTRRTVLHHLSEAFPIFHKDLSSGGRTIFFDVLTKLKSDFNVSSQDENGNTVLHILAKKCTLEIPPKNRDFYIEVISNLSKQKCDVDGKDKQGCTVLHILAKAYPTDGLEGSVKKFLELMKHLAEKSKGNIKDNDGNTILHILARKYNRNMSVGHHDLFCELIKALSEINCSVDIQDKEGQTFVHLLVEKYPNEVPEHTAKAFIELIQHFIERSKGKLHKEEFALQI